MWAIAKNLLPSDAPQAQVQVVLDSGATQPVPVPMDIEPNLTHSSSMDLVNSSEVPQSDTLTLRYIHCQSLFAFQAEEKALHGLSPTITLEQLVALISSTEGVTEDMTLELFFSEGYLLDANKITLNGTYMKGLYIF